jgi:3-hydroxypropanoate dehydrogenase
MHNSKPRPLHSETAYTRRLYGEALLDVLFREAQAPTAWQSRAVPDEPLRRAIDLASVAPTTFNCSPMRVILVRSAVGKRRLMSALTTPDLERTMAAPVTAIVGFDLAFHEHLPHLYPYADLRSWFARNLAQAATTAFRNGTMQGAYLILAARALGLDCDPVSSFDNAIVDAEFFPQSAIRSNFLCNMGYAEPTVIPPRGPQLSFDEIASTV